MPVPPASNSPASSIGPALASAPCTTLVEAFLALEERAGTWLTVHHGKQSEAFDGPQLLQLARRWRAAARACGLKAGDRVALLLPNDQHFVAAFAGVLLAGATPVPLAWPAAMSSPERALAPLRPLVQKADPRLVLTIPGAELGWDRPCCTAPASQPDRGDVQADPEAPAFLQLTSGSMGRPRGAVISHRAAVSCAWSMAQGMGLTDQDIGLSWLPLYHDMGLVGAVLVPLLKGFPLHLMRPGEFLLHPQRWLDQAARHGATVTAAPDFAWRLLTRRGTRFEGDLSRFRIGLDGAEPVHRSTLEAVHAAFGRFGLPPGMVRPAYGLAENTLGVCIADPLTVAADLQREGRILPSAGGPLPGVELAIVRADGQPCASGEEGEIRVRSRSTMSGYFRDEAASAAALQDGWLCTGDLGVLAQGQLYVSGRIKDLVIQNGVKFHPYDIERIAAETAASTPNGAAAFAVDGEEGEELVVVVEVSARHNEDVEQRVRGALVEALGVRAGRVLTVAPGGIPRTTSGKVRRPECRRLFGDLGGGHGVA